MQLEVKPGLYVLRYVGSKDVRSAPLAFVQPAIGSTSQIGIIGVPGVRLGELGAPGASAVIVAVAPGSLEIRLAAFQGSQNLDARFSLELLGTAEAQHSTPALDRATSMVGYRGEQRPQRAEVSLDLVAHVSRRGDVRADEDGWVAGPRAPSAIEAIQVNVYGCDVGLSAQFRNIESRASWSSWLAPGAMIGVPKKACALTGIRLKLVGSEADRYVLMGEGLFLGSSKISTKGSEIEFVAPGELDPMVGLKLAIAERESSSSAVAKENTSRVRVFR